MLWQSLEVIDCRSTTHPDEIAAHVWEHMRLAYNGGRINSVITVFAPIEPNVQPAYIESAQIIQYAGYTGADGKTVGDRRNIEITRVAQSLGWQAPVTPGHFDILPLIIRDAFGARRLYELPALNIRTVNITHPECAKMSELGLCWYAVPIVSGMIMTIGGIDYPCAPFNGFYMATEIASRNFADENRYDLLPAVAEALGISTHGNADKLWKDRVLLELNRAVLHSFGKAGVTIIDHHSASEQYMDFTRREHAAGRVPSGEWSWIVPPDAGAACPVFHLPMTNLNSVPNFYYSRATDGAALYQNYADETHTTKTMQRWRRFQKYMRDWRRRWR